MVGESGKPGGPAPRRRARRPRRKARQSPEGFSRTRLAGAILLLLGGAAFWALGDFLIEGVRDSEAGAGDLFAVLGIVTFSGLFLLAGGRRAADALSFSTNSQWDFWVPLGLMCVVVASLLAVAYWPSLDEKPAVAATDPDAQGNLYDPASAPDLRLDLPKVDWASPGSDDDKDPRPESQLNGQ